MIYIWTDESDTTGKYYANFYGGILIRSEHLEEVLARLSAVVKEQGLENEEIKWQKVNEYTEVRYKSIIDVLFSLMSEGKIKMRMFFRHRQFEATGLTNEQRRKEYPMLYYQFIKNDFGLIHSNPAGKEVRVRLLIDDMPLKGPARDEFLLTNEQRRKEYPMLYYQFIKNDFGLIHSNPAGKEVRVRLLIDDMPLKGPARDEFLKAIYHLNELKSFQKANIHIKDGDIAEVNSKKHLPLQVMDLILGSMCFRLNDKHKERGIDGKRAKRNIVKERIYKYIRTKIWQLHPGFNIGITTPITKQSDLWERPYLHWNFVPRNYTKNEELTKRHKTETAPYNLHE